MAILRKALTIGWVTIVLGHLHRCYNESFPKHSQPLAGRANIIFPLAATIPTYQKLRSNHSSKTEASTIAVLTGIIIGFYQLRFLHMVRKKFGRRPEENRAEY